MKFKLLFILLLICNVYCSQQINLYIDSISELLLNETEESKELILEKQLTSIKHKKYVNFIEAILTLKKAKKSYSQNQFEQSLQLLNESYNYFNRNNCNEKYKIEIYSTLSCIQDKKGEYSKSISSMDSVLFLSKKNNDKQTYTNTKINKAILYLFSLNEKDSALKILQNINGNELDSIYKCRFYLCKGKIYVLDERQDSAIIYFKKIEKIADNINNLEYSYQSKNLISSIYKKNFNFQKAITLDEECLTIAQKSNNKDLLLSSYNNYGSTLLKLNKPKEAIRYLTKAYDLAIETKNVYSEIITYQNIAQYYRSINNNEKTKEYYLKILNKQQENIPKKVLIPVLTNFASTELRLQNYKSAEKYFLLALNKTTNSNYDNGLIHCYKGLYKTYEKQNMYKESLFYYKKYDSISDHINGLKLSEKLKKLELDFEKKEKDQKIHNLQTRVSFLAKEKQQQRKTSIITWLLAIAILLISFLISIVFIKKNRIKKYIIASIYNNIKEIEIEKSELQKKVKTLSDDTQNKDIIIEHLKHNKPTTQGNLLSELILNGLKSNKDWSIFITEFQLNFPEFYKKINLLANPTLTKTDLKIISLIKLNLTNNEMALLLSITTSGVKKAKQRVSLKFNTNNMSIEEFIHSI